MGIGSIVPPNTHGTNSFFIHSFILFIYKNKLFIWNNKISDWSLYIKPTELKDILNDAGLELVELKGLLLSITRELYFFLKISICKGMKVVPSFDLISRVLTGGVVEETDFSIGFIFIIVDEYLFFLNI